MQSAHGARSCAAPRARGDLRAAAACAALAGKPDSASEPQGALTLTVGYHEVEGKLTALKKPLVVLRRAQADGAGEHAAYEAVGVIRKKFNFKNRPKALISAAEPGKRMKTAQNAALRSFFGKAEAK